MLQEGNVIIVKTKDEEIWQRNLKLFQEPYGLYNIVKKWERTLSFKVSTTYLRTLPLGLH